MKITYTDEQIRQWLGRLLDNGRMTLPEWGFVKRRGFVEEFRNALEEYADAGEAALEDELSLIAQNAAQLITDHREAFPDALGGNVPVRGQRMARRHEEQPMGEDDDTPREILLSYAAASLAAQDPEVRVLRDFVCGVEPFIGLVEDGRWMNTAEWIEAQWHGERWGYGSVPEGLEDEWPVLQYVAYPNGQWNSEREVWEDASGPLKTLRVIPGGVLDQLRQVAARLAREYRWDQSAAVNFILTDDAPVTPPLSVRVEWCERVPAYSRIVLVVDPAIAPQDLLAQYQEARRQLVGHEFPRILDRKTLWLAARSAGRTATASVSDLMAEWNNEMEVLPRPWQRGWAYHDKERFARDRRRAEQRVLRFGYHCLANVSPPSDDTQQGSNE